MPTYDCLFINHADAIFSRESFHADSDEAAIQYARTVYDSSIGKGFELWEGDRLIHQHTR